MVVEDVSSLAIEFVPPTIDWSSVCSVLLVEISASSIVSSVPDTSSAAPVIFSCASIVSGTFAISLSSIKLTVSSTLADGNTVFAKVSIKVAKFGVRKIYTIYYVD